MIKTICDSCKKEVEFAHKFTFPGYTDLEGDKVFPWKPNQDICNECYMKMREAIKI